MDKSPPVSKDMWEASIQLSKLIYGRTNQFIAEKDIAAILEKYLPQPPLPSDKLMGLVRKIKQMPHNEWSAETLGACRAIADQLEALLSQEPGADK